MGASRVSQFVAMAEEFEDVSEGVFHVNHSVGLFTWEVFTHGHALLTTCCDDLCKEPLKARILDRKAEGPMPAKGAIVVWNMVSGEFEEFDANAISCRQMRDPPKHHFACEMAISECTMSAMIRTKKEVPHVSQ